MQTLGSIISGTEDGERKPDGGSNVGSDSFENGVSEPEERTGKPETIAGYPAVAPIEWTTGTEAPSIPKRRGRPPGTRNRDSAVAGTSASRTEKTTSNLADLDGLILSAHLLVAKMLSVPELELDEKESEKLAASIRNVAKHYTTVFDPKKIAIFELACCAGGIYGPRAVALYKTTERKPKPAKVTTIERPAAEQKVSLSDLSPSQIWQEGG